MISLLFTTRLLLLPPPFDCHGALRELRRPGHLLDVKAISPYLLFMYITTILIHPFEHKFLSPRVTHPPGESSSSSDDDKSSILHSLMTPSARMYRPTSWPSSPMLCNLSDSEMSSHDLHGPLHYDLIRFFGPSIQTPCFQPLLAIPQFVTSFPAKPNCGVFVEFNEDCAF